MSEENKRIISIVSPNKDVYSETFIRAHIDRLPADVKPLYGYPLPNQTGDNRELYSSTSLKNRVLRTIGRRFFNLTNESLHKSAIKNFLLSQRVDLLLAEYGHSGVSMMEICQEANIPLVVHFHGHDAYHENILDNEGQNYPSLFMNSAALIVVSRDMQRQLIQLGAPSEKIFINPYGVVVSQFNGANPAVAKPIFVSVGRFVDKKAPHLTIIAFSRVLEAYPEAKLIMIGDGPLQEACQQLTRALDISDAVEFRGVCVHDQVAAEMQLGRAFVQHSIKTSYGDSEGTPVAVLEASAAGLPVVATRHAGIMDVILDGETGLLVEEGDIQGMAEAMSQLIQNPSLAARFGKNGRERVKSEYSITKSINSLWEIIEYAIEKYQSN
jgi:colanic acid/amylovoran biosynthesis glycosyltransferase